MNLKIFKKNINGILVNFMGNVLTALFLGLITGAFWLAIEYTRFKDKLEVHQEKISQLEKKIDYYTFKTKLDESPTVSQKIYTDKLAKIFQHESMPRENFHPTLEIIKNNDVQVAKEKLLSQGLMTPQQLNSVFKNNIERQIMTDKPPIGYEQQYPDNRPGIK